MKNSEVKKPEKMKKIDDYFKKKKWTIESDIRHNQDADAYNKGLDVGLNYSNHVLSKLPSEDDIKKLIVLKHIYVDGGCDNDRFVVIPINDLAQAIHKRIQEAVAWKQ